MLRVRAAARSNSVRASGWRPSLEEVGADAGEKPAGSSRTTAGRLWYRLWRILTLARDPTGERMVRTAGLRRVRH